MVARLQYLRVCLIEVCVNVVFVIRRLYSAVSLTLVKEQRLIRIIYIKLIKIKEKQEVGIKVPQFSADAFLGGLI